MFSNNLIYRTEVKLVIAGVKELIEVEEVIEIDDDGKKIKLILKVKEKSFIKMGGFLFKSRVHCI